MEENFRQVVDGKKGFICDMDGVIYHGNRLLPGAKEFVQWLNENGNSPENQVSAPLTTGKNDAANTFSAMNGIVFASVSINAPKSAGNASRKYFSILNIFFISSIKNYLAVCFVPFRFCGRDIFNSPVYICGGTSPMPSIIYFGE